MTAKIPASDRRALGIPAALRSITRQAAKPTAFKLNKQAKEALRPGNKKVCASDKEKNNKKMVFGKVGFV